ncbi:hypothetical protein Zmor_003525 [Zophobas morio]|uniref:Uncharacterized protein n=1 Tax=Zophobas morio TaxID=2755281 RepID=A0AA38HNE8_9CUCU|nr:hypothetical protein Zmor_003525 [Zophobas morio]
MEDEQRWDEAVSAVRWGLNSTANSSTGKSPYELLFGCVPRSTGTAFLANEVAIEPENAGDVQAMRANAKARIDAHQSKRKASFDAHRRAGRTYKKGEQGNSLHGDAEAGSVADCYRCRHVAATGPAPVMLAPLAWTGAERRGTAERNDVCKWHSLQPPPLQWGAGVRPQTPIKAHTGDVKQSHRNISKVSTGDLPTSASTARS